MKFREFYRENGGDMTVSSTDPNTNESRAVKLKSIDADWKSWDDTRIDQMAMDILQFAASKGSIESVMSAGDPGNFRDIVRKRKDVPDAIRAILG